MSRFEASGVGHFGQEINDDVAFQTTKGVSLDDGGHVI